VSESANGNLPIPEKLVDVKRQVSKGTSPYLTLSVYDHRIILYALIHSGQARAQGIRRIHLNALSLKKYDSHMQSFTILHKRSHFEEFYTPFESGDQNEPF